MKSSSKKIDLLLVLLVAFIDWMGIGLVYPMFSSMLFSKETPLLPLATSDTVRGLILGLLLAAMPIAQFFSAPLMGALSDQKGRKPILNITLTAGIAGYILATFGVAIQSIALLVIARLIVGISAGNGAVVTAAIADLSAPANKAKNFGLLSMACGIGFTLGPFIGGRLTLGPISFLPPFALPFIFAAGVTAVNLLLVYFYFRETHAKPKTAAIRWNQGWHNLKKALHMPQLRETFICFFFFGFGWSFFYEFIPVTWIALYGFGAAMIGLFYAYGAAVYALSSGLLIRPVVARFSSERILFSALVLMCLYMPLQLLKFPPVGLWLYMAPLNFLAALIYPTATTLVSNNAGDDMQGEALGIFQSVHSAAFALSPLVSGSLLGISSQMPSIVGSLCMLLAAIPIGRYLLLKKQT